MTIDIERAKRLRASGMGYDEITATLGTTLHQVRKIFDQAYAIRNVKWKYVDADFMGAAARADAERLLAEVPPDTRGLTERLMGDPIPGRRAIDLKHKGQ